MIHRVPPAAWRFIGSCMASKIAVVTCRPRIAWRCAAQNHCRSCRTSSRGWMPAAASYATADSHAERLRIVQLFMQLESVFRSSAQTAKTPNMKSQIPTVLVLVGLLLLGFVVLVVSESSDPPITIYTGPSEADAGKIIRVECEEPNRSLLGWSNSLDAVTDLKAEQPSEESRGGIDDVYCMVFLPDDGKPSSGLNPNILTLSKLE